MADYGAVQLFLGAAAGAPLEVANTVRTVSHGLQGRKLGAVLAQLLDEVIDGVTKNTQEALTTRAREIYSEIK